MKKFEVVKNPIRKAKIDVYVLTIYDTNTNVHTPIAMLNDRKAADDFIKTFNEIVDDALSLGAKHVIDSFKEQTEKLLRND